MVVHFIKKNSWDFKLQFVYFSVCILYFNKEQFTLKSINHELLAVQKNEGCLTRIYSQMFKPISHYKFVICLGHSDGIA